MMQNQIDDNISIEDVYNTKDFRKLGHELIDVLADHLSDLQNGKDNIVYSNQNPEKELQFWQEDFENESSSINLFKEISKHYANPKILWGERNEI